VVSGPLSANWGPVFSHVRALTIYIAGQLGEIITQFTQLSTVQAAQVLSDSVAVGLSLYIRRWGRRRRRQIRRRSQTQVPPVGVRGSVPIVDRGLGDKPRTFCCIW